jgi:chemotaxis protein methyltransferase CheR
MKKITSQEIKEFADYVYKISGIHLDESKGYLLESRLNPLLVSHKLAGYEELLKRAKRDNSKELQGKIIDAISTNETFFFRDKTPFTVLQYKLIPELIDRRQKLYKSKQIPLRILSAACSSGQEVYSIAITLLEEIPNINNYDITILGVDIADEMIAKSSYGKYGKFEVERGLSPNMLRKYFYPVDNGWRIKDQVRVMANFKKVNLLESFSNLGYFDIIFCRNVAIYFKYNDKVKLFKKLARILEPDGALIVGGSESLTGVAPDFQVNHYLKGIYYTLKDNSKEKSKDVKKFEVHAFNKTLEAPKHKKIKKIKRTIKYISPEENKQKPNSLQETQNTIERLKQKRLAMAQKSEALNKSTAAPNTDLINREVVDEQKVREPVNIQDDNVNINKRTLNESINSKIVTRGSLLNSISQKYVNQKTLTIKTQSANRGKSLLGRISQNKS